MSDFTEGDTFPTRLVGECGDCGTATSLEHPDGIGGEGMSWPCLVCGNPVRMDGSGYVTRPTPPTSDGAR